MLDRASRGPAGKADEGARSPYNQVSAARAGPSVDVRYLRALPAVHDARPEGTFGEAGRASSPGQEPSLRGAEVRAPFPAGRRSLRKRIRYFRPAVRRDLGSVPQGIESIRLRRRLGRRV